MVAASCGHRVVGKGLGDIERAAPTYRGMPLMLTPREREVLALVARGLTAYAAARQLGIGERTVHTHLRNAYMKLRAPNRVSAVLRAQQAGLLTRL